MFDRWLDSYRRWWCALSGLLLVACFAPFSCATCGWLALIPAWWLLSRSERVQKKPFRYGYVIGLIYFGGTFWWISNVTAIGTFFLVLYLALYPAMWFMSVALLIRPTRNQPSLVVLLQAFGAASLWVLLEWLRSWFLTGFNWNELGISQAQSIIFRQLAAFGGVHLISFVLVTVNILWADGLLRVVENFSQKKEAPAKLGRLDSFLLASIETPTLVCALLIIASCFALCVHHLLRHTGEASSVMLRYACIQPNIPQIPYDPGKPYADFQFTENAALEKTEKLTLDAISAPAKTRLLIWPEAMIDQGVFQDRPLNEAVHDICQAYNGYFLLGSQDFDIGAGRKIYNCAYFFAPHGEQYDEYRKTRLVILGEFLPFGDTFPWLRKQLGMGMDFTPGPGPKVFTMKDPALTFAPLICFEDTLPEVADKAAQLHPDFFITITNDGWYRGWCADWGVRQHLNHAIFRCVEHDRPMIRCANTGISCQIDQKGSVVNRYQDASGTEIDVTGVFRGILQFAPPQPTLYEKWGDWIILISSLVSVMLGIRFFVRSRA